MFCLISFVFFKAAVKLMTKAKTLKVETHCAMFGGDCSNFMYIYFHHRIAPDDPSYNLYIYIYMNCIYICILILFAISNAQIRPV